MSSLSFFFLQSKQKNFVFCEIEGLQPQVKVLARLSYLPVSTKRKVDGQTEQVVDKVLKC